MTTKQIALLVAVLAVVNGSLAFVVHGNLPCILLVVLAVMLGVIVLGVGGFAFLVSTFLAKKVGIRNSNRIMLVGVMICSLASTIPLGSWIHDKDVAAAKQYCEEMIPPLEDYRQRHGTYPATLDLLGDVGPRPRLLREEKLYYNGNEKSYSFSFSEPSCFLGAHNYDSEKKAWTFSD
jgi:hypothetical protein